MMNELKALEMEVEKMNPRLSLTSEMLKDLEGWKVGSTYKIELTVKQIEKEEELDEPTEAKFEVLSAKSKY